MTIPCPNGIPPWAEEKLKLLGKNVRVTLDRPEASPAIVTIGKLLAFGTDGTVVVEQDDGFVHYCWPMLDIEEVQ